MPAFISSELLWLLVSTQQQTDRKLLIVASNSRWNWKSNGPGPGHSSCDHMFDLSNYFAYVRRQ
jgi:hypothetical protein